MAVASATRCLIAEVLEEGSSEVGFFCQDESKFMKAWNEMKRDVDLLSQKCGGLTPQDHETNSYGGSEDENPRYTEAVPKSYS